MENVNNKNSFLIACVSSIVFLLVLCYFGIYFSKGTSAATDCNGNDQLKYDFDTKNQYCVPAGTNIISSSLGGYYCPKTVVASSELSEENLNTVCKKTYGANSAGAGCVASGSEYSCTCQASLTYCGAYLPGSSNEDPEEYVPDDSTYVCFSGPADGYWWAPYGQYKDNNLYDYLPGVARADCADGGNVCGVDGGYGTWTESSCEAAGHTWSSMDCCEINSSSSNECKVVGITVGGSPKTSYVVGEPLDYTSLVINVESVGCNGDPSDITHDSVSYGTSEFSSMFSIAPTEGVTFTKPIASSPIDITYLKDPSISTSYNIQVTEAADCEVVGITVGGEPKTLYAVGEPLDYTSLVINVERVDCKGDPSDTTFEPVSYGTSKFSSMFSIAPTEGVTFTKPIASSPVDITYLKDPSISTSYNVTVTDGNDYYVVKYNANGGNGIMADTTCTSGAPCSTTKNAFTRSCYRFNGWTGSDGKNYSDGASVTITSDLTLTAKWTYVCGGGGTTDPTPPSSSSSSSSYNPPSSNPDVPSNEPSNGNVEDNPQTGQIAIFVVWVIALAAIVYSVWYFKKIREN